MMMIIIVHAVVVVGVGAWVVQTPASSRRCGVVSTTTAKWGLVRRGQCGTQHRRRVTRRALSRRISEEATQHAVDAASYSELLVSLEGRLAAMAATTRPKLATFYDPKLKSFAVEPGAPKFSVTSTAFAVDALLATRKTITEGDATSRSLLFEDNEERTLAAALLDAEWREGDLFQLPLVVRAVAKLAAVDESERKDVYARLPRLKKAIEELAGSRVTLANTWRQQLSCYLQYWLAASLLAVIDDDSSSSNDSSLSFPLLKAAQIETRPLALALARAHEVARNEVCRQIALHASGDDDLFDVWRLCYSLLAYAAVGEKRDKVVALWGENVNDNEKEAFHAPGGPDQIAVNDKLVKRALDAFFKSQRSQLWPAGQAIYAKSRRAYEVGNAFVFAPDALASLFDTFPPGHFKPYLANLEAVISWAEAREDARGWRSNFLAPEGPPVAWATAQMLKCANLGLRVVQTLLNEDVLAEFDGVSRFDDEPASKLFDKLSDSDLTETETLKCTLASRFLRPRGKAGDFDCGPGEPSLVPTAYSAVLFGPPGTAKSTTAEAVARALKFGFCVVDTAVFLEDGLTKVASRVAYVFKRLKLLKDCVILLDEIEEFCLDRQSALGAASVESRMLTTAMLTQLNDLRQRKRSVFFIATNRLPLFDKAIIRPGRIDLLLFVGTPAIGPRVDRFRSKLKASTFASGEFLSRSSTVPLATDTFRAFLAETWQADTMFLNFLEAERFADAAADALFAATSAVDFDAAAFTATLRALLDQQRNTMLLRDASSREEYLDGQRLTRI